MDSVFPEFTPLFDQQLLAEGDEIEGDEEEDEEMSRGAGKMEHFTASMYQKIDKSSALALRPLNITSLLMAYQAELLEELGTQLDADNPNQRRSATSQILIYAPHVVLCKAAAVPWLSLLQDLSPPYGHDGFVTVCGPSGLAEKEELPALGCGENYCA
ncbi:putative GAG protein [Labeo rohita]|uniref:Putative GAG protein n=1 Tax=Labeo rohita TaxID=84645 RepID=A0A498P222_LABRO|nr:putative GAG protein [Labeo rohita]